MGGTVSREHARLPFGYTHARKEDHSWNASTSSFSRRQRIANRLFLKSQDSTTSVTPLQPPHHRLPLAEDGSLTGGAGGGGTGANWVPGGGMEGEGPVGPSGSLPAHLSLASLSSQDDDDADDGDNAEIVSLSSILNQGPEFKLQWHAVSQDLDLDPNVHTYPYPYTYPIPYAGVSITTGSETVAAAAAAESSTTLMVVDEDIKESNKDKDSSCGVQSPLSMSMSKKKASYSRSAAVPALAATNGDPETAAGGSCSSPGMGSSPSTSLLLTSAAAAAATGAANHDAHPQLPLVSQPHASVLSQSRTACVATTVSTAAATATNSLLNNPHALSLSALLHTDNTLSDNINDGPNNSNNALTGKSTNIDNDRSQEDSDSVQPSPQRKQSLDPLRQSSSQQDLIGSASTVFEVDDDDDDDLDDSDDNMKGTSDRKMDLIAALGIANIPDRAPSPGPEDIPFSFFTEEPTFHAFQDPTSCQLFNNTRRYTTDGCGYSKGKEVGRPWMDQTDEAIVHLPQDFFDRYGPTQQDLDGDGLGDDYDGEIEQEELPRSRRLGKRLSLGATMAGYSTAAANSGGHNMSANSSMMMTMMMLSAPDEDVAHLSPIPFSELPSLTNIGLCSKYIVKLSSNIRLLSSATCLQICCNDLCAIPPEIGFLRNLTLLDLSNNSLMAIPDSIRFLTKLIDLKLSSNFIDTLPPSIGELSKLTHLSMENNQLKRVPRQLGQLKALTHLILDDNPITVLPGEIGQLQYLRRLSLERCPLVQEFVHSPVHSPPTLMELAARVILRQGMVVPPLLPSHLKAYLRTSQKCSFCDGPYFESSVKRGKMVEKNEFLVPLEYTLCVSHWNTEAERVKLLFGPRPVTSPKMRSPRRAASATGLLPATSEAGSIAATATATTTTAATAAATTTTTTRRHTKSESAGPVLASTSTILFGTSSSPVTSSPVGQAPMSPLSLAPITMTTSTSGGMAPLSEVSSPNDSSGSGSGSGSTGRKNRRFRTKLGSSGGNSNSGWFSSSNNNSETNLTTTAALPPVTSTVSSTTSAVTMTTGSGAGPLLEASMTVTAPPSASTLRTSFSSRTKSRFSKRFSSSRSGERQSISSP
ncbi:hypothetical protein BGX33_001712 [Mortierella sp. NVP41]|nr:hypothetical protein BGX33_001712 [Mortierella sp. NVP41]